MKPISDFNYGNGSQANIITEVKIEVNGINTPLTKKMGLHLLSNEMSRFVADSPYAQFKPLAAICHAHVWGWSSGYTIVFYANMNEFQTMKERKFVSEPTGKYARKRNEFLIQK